MPRPTPKLNAALHLAELETKARCAQVTAKLRQEMDHLVAEHSLALTRTIEHSFSEVLGKLGSLADNEKTIEQAVKFGEVTTCDANGHHVSTSIAGTSVASKRESRRVSQLHALEIADAAEDNVTQSRSELVWVYLRSLDPIEALDYFAGLLIISNAITMIVALEWKGIQMGAKLGVMQSGGWPGAANAFFVMDHIFCASFLLELILRLSLLRGAFFMEPINIVDASVVVLSSVELYILLPLYGASLGNLTVLRLLRLTRLVRTVKVVKTIPAFSGMRVLAKSIACMLPSLFWSMVLLFICMTMAGLTLGTLLEDYILDESMPYEWRFWVWKHYGSSHSAIYSMYEVTLAGCWPNYVRPLIENVSGAYAVFFATYVALVCFAILRVISAIFLKETLTAAQADQDIVMQERMSKKEKYSTKLHIAFLKMDESGDGMISRDEFKVIMHDPLVQNIMHLLELEVHEGDMLFDILDDGDGHISYDEFIGGVMRLKGTARSLDMIALRNDLHKLRNELRVALGKPRLTQLQSAAEHEPEEHDMAQELLGLRSLS
eukprot:TRINITY_DN25845_c0_g1_i1.p1 TRINITY_DN25845_c0_g1~~TRINITY_DN25845_c0_g1_i1.p1  ORF type:complete len:549 (-),score=86.14 TRINITY_DN25845_c0_g1_i1:99-1745(-)